MLLLQLIIFSTQGRNHTQEVFADVLTYSGGDTDTTGFDSNDELVFMARHLGEQYDNIGSYPPETLPVRNNTAINNKLIKFSSLT